MFELNISTGLNVCAKHLTRVIVQAEYLRHRFFIMTPQVYLYIYFERFMEFGWWEGGQEAVWDSQMDSQPKVYIPVQFRR